MFPYLRKTQSADQVPKPQPKAPAILTPQMPAITLSGATTPGGHNNLLSEILAGGSAQQQATQAAGNLSSSAGGLTEMAPSQEAVIAQGLGLATGAAQGLPVAEPKTPSAKVKAKMRKMLLRKFILRLILGKKVANLVHPLINPKAGGIGVPGL